jgi:hypothetical protein
MGDEHEYAAGFPSVCNVRDGGCDTRAGANGAAGGRAGQQRNERRRIDPGLFPRMGSSVPSLVRAAGFLYDSDHYGDELPIWKTVSGTPHLIVPYSLTNNDGKYAGWVGTSDQWFATSFGRCQELCISGRQQ